MNQTLTSMRSGLLLLLCCC